MEALPTSSAGALLRPRDRQMSGSLRVTFEEVEERVRGLEVNTDASKSRTTWRRRSQCDDSCSSACAEGLMRLVRALRGKSSIAGSGDGLSLEQDLTSGREVMIGSDMDIQTLLRYARAIEERVSSLEKITSEHATASCSSSSLGASTELAIKAKSATSPSEEERFSTPPPQRESSPLHQDILPSSCSTSASDGQLPSSASVSAATSPEDEDLRVQAVATTAAPEPLDAEPIAEPVSFPKARRQLGRAQSAPDPPGHQANQLATCVICMSAPRECAFTPCGHRCVCRICGITAVRSDRRCPICRMTAGRLLRIIDP